MIDISDSQVLTCNKLAMESLRKGHIGKCEDYLSKARALMQNKPKTKQLTHLWAITFNNLACFYKRKNDFPLALKYLNLALENEDAKETANVAGIHLNISAIFSVLENHESSLTHALKSKRLLQNSQEKDKNIWLSLIISYRCIGFELEKLGKNSPASKAYLKGWELAQDHLGAFHTVTESIKKNYYALQKTASKASQRSKTPVLYQKSSNISMIDKGPEERNRSVVKKTRRGKVFKAENDHKRVESLKNIDTLDLLVGDIEIEYGGFEKNKIVNQFIQERVEGTMERSHTSTEFEQGVKGKVESSVETMGKGPKRKNKLDKEVEREPQMFLYELEKNSNGNQEKNCEIVGDVEEIIVKEKIFEDLSSQTEFVREDKATQTREIVSKPFFRIAATIIQREWRRYKVSQDPEFWQRLQTLKDAQKLAEIALHNVETLKSQFKGTIKDTIPVPKHYKIKLDSEEIRSSVTLIQNQIRRWLTSKKSQIPNVIHN